MPWPEYFIVREMGQTFEALAQQLRVAISHTTSAGARELQQAHAMVQTLQKQYAALEMVLRESNVAPQQLQLPPEGGKLLGEVAAELEAMQAKVERIEAAMKKKKRPRPRKKAPP